jgi:uncharacterized lipoprotein YddW (UPF0748 family)
MRRLRIVIAISVILGVVLIVAISQALGDQDEHTYFPMVRTPPGTELRGMWVTRFDWTDGVNPAEPAVIDQIVADAALAGFNAIFFQVRGSADAYYQPGPEPWAKRVSGSALGLPPPDNRWGGEDPLSYFIRVAHEQGIQLHAYVNVYPVHDSCAPPPHTSPEHLYYKLLQAHGSTSGKANGLQWNSAGGIDCRSYWRATPASTPADDQFLAVARYLVENYNIDGLHLDHIRYAGANTSCDPVSISASGINCTGWSTPFSASYAEWQRTQVNGTVWKFYNEIILKYPGLWLSAAVWPVYKDYWGWGGFSQGYNDYYQDSKAWIKGGYIDALMPMIYPGTTKCPDDSVWTKERWNLLVENFQGDASGRFIVAGIGANYCSFNEIADRIEMARERGIAGHALFSYGALRDRGYFDDLAAGPYAQKADPPQIGWHP